jgi:hypothetical protein
MRLKKQHVILLGVIAILLIYLLLGTGRNKISYKVPRLTQLAQEEITKVEIFKADQSLVLSGQEEDWLILPQEYPADPVKVRDMLETISGLTLTELAAEKENYERYELDEGGRIRVKAYSGEQVVREFDIGKVPSTYRHTFVRLADDTKVYYARESFRSRFDQEIKDLRHKVVMTFDKNEISEIRITQAGETMTLSKTMVPVEPESKPADQEGEDPETATVPEPAEQEAWVTSEGKTADNNTLDAILSEMSDLRCDEFLEEDISEQEQEPVFAITVKGSKDFTLRIFTKQDDDAAAKYPALSSESPYAFLLSTYRAERIIKKQTDLFPEVDTEKEEK